MNINIRITDSTASFEIEYNRYSVDFTYHVELDQDGYFIRKFLEEEQRKSLETVLKKIRNDGYDEIVDELESLESNIVSFIIKQMQWEGC